MSEHRGAVGDTAAARQRVLAGRLTALADADSAFTATLHEAHRTYVSARGQLDGIEAEIRRAVADRPDTPAGAVALRRFLTAKTRQIETIVADAAADGRQRAERVRELLADYRLDEPPNRPAGG